MKLIQWILNLFHTSPDSHFKTEVSHNPFTNVHETLQVESIEWPTYPQVIKAKSNIFIGEIENNSDTIKGVSEDYFFDYARIDGLEKYRCIKFNSQSICPDFTYIDKEKNLRIAIEIDEPYTLSNNSLIPIHYPEADRKKEELLSNNGWTIIRFAEEQIIKTPMECVKFITSYIRKAEIDNNINIKEINRWSKNDAEVFIENKFRDDYLSSPLDDQKRTNGKNSYRSLIINWFELGSGNGKGDYYLFTECNRKIKIDRELFGNKIASSSFGETLLKYEDVFELKPNDTLIIPFRLEAIGHFNEKYFNLANNTKFDVKFSEDKYRALNNYLKLLNNRTILDLNNNDIDKLIYLREELKKIC